MTSKSARKIERIEKVHLNSFFLRNGKRVDSFATLKYYYAEQFLKRQEQIRLWLQDITHSEFPHSGKEMAARLTDGVVLCKLINEIRPDTLPIHLIHHRPSNEYEIVENVRHFLESCKVLGLPDKELFQPDDLIENKNWIKVVYCLQALADLAKQLHFRVQIQQDVDSMTSSLQEQDVTDLIEHLDLTEIAEHEGHVTVLDESERDPQPLNPTTLTLLTKENDTSLPSHFVLAERFPNSNWHRSLLYILISFLCMGVWYHFAHQSPYFLIRDYETFV